MVDWVRILNGVWISNCHHYSSVFEWSGPFEIQTMASHGTFIYKEKLLFEQRINEPGHHGWIIKKNYIYN